MNDPNFAPSDAFSRVPEAESTDTADREQTGSALIVAIAVLFVMIVMGMALLNVSTGERKSSLGYVDKVRARMLAMSGLEQVRAEKRRAGNSEAAYHGEDWNANGSDNPVQDPDNRAGGTEMENGDGDGQLETAVAPRYALHPSYAGTDSNTNRPELIRVRRGERTLWRGYTGKLPSSYAGHGTDTYAVKVETTPRLNVNSLNPNIGATIDAVYRAKVGSATTRPGRVLVGRFSDVSVRRIDANGNGVYGDGGDRREVRTSAKRPPVSLDLETMEVRGGYGSMSEVKEDLVERYGGAEGNRIYETLKTFVTVGEHLSLDTSVIRPLPQNTDLTFDEDGDCPAGAGPYDPCRKEGPPGRDLRDAYPIPDETPGRPKAIRGKINDDGTADGTYDFRGTTDSVTEDWSNFPPGNWKQLVTPTSDMIHSERMFWMNLVREPFTNESSDQTYQVGEPLDRTARDDERVVRDVTGTPLGEVKGTNGYNYGAFRYNFDYRKQPRAPVYVNEAPEYLLAGLIRGIRARVVEIPSEASIKATTGLDFTDDGSRHPMAPATKDANEDASFPMYQTRVIPDPDGTAGIDPSTAEEIAREIARYADGNTPIQFRGIPDYRGPFQTWSEFEAFVDQVIVDSDHSGDPNGGLGLSNDVGYLLKAHFNPNTRAMGKLNGNRAAIWTWTSDGKDNPSARGNRVFLDKADFLYYTTEFTFLDVHPVEVTSYGRVTGPQGRVKAESTITAVLDLRNVAKHTSQADFAVNRQERKTRNMLTYPESEVNMGTTVKGGTTVARVKLRREVKETTLQGEWAFRSGSGLSGQLSVATRKDTFGMADPYTNWGMDRPDESTRGIPERTEDAKEFHVWENVDRLWTDDHPYVQWTFYPRGGPGVWPKDSRNSNNPHLPYAWTSREFNDVSDDGTPYNAGVLGGKWNPGEDRDGDGTTDYPWNERKNENLNAYKTKARAKNAEYYEDPTEDPYNYSDVTADGMLMTTDRYRSLRFLATAGKPEVLGWGTGNFSTGHVEFWWKPRAGTLAGTGDSLSEQRMVFPLWSRWTLNPEGSFKVHPLAYTTGNGPDTGASGDTGSWDFYDKDLIDSFDDDGGGGIRRDQSEAIRKGVSGNDGSYAYKRGDTPYSDGHHEPVIGTAPAKHLDTSRGYYRGPAGERGVGRPPAVDETQPWAGYDCDYAGHPDHNSRYANGQGIVARLYPDTGCLEAMPGIQPHLSHFFLYTPGKRYQRITDGGLPHEVDGHEDTMRDAVDFRVEGPRGFRTGEAKGPDIGNKGPTGNTLVDGSFVSFTKFFESTGDGLGSKEGALGRPESRPYYTYKTGGGDHQDGPLGGPNGDKFALGKTAGYYFRSYFVKEPAHSGRSSKWVFKISQESFMDMDVGLRALGNDYSPPISTTGPGRGLPKPQSRHSWHWRGVQADEDRTVWDDTDLTKRRNTYFQLPSSVYAVLDTGAASLTASERKKVIPRPGKWTHVTLEWEVQHISEYTRGTVGSDDRATGYPWYLPWDPWEDDTPADSNGDGTADDDGDGTPGDVDRDGIKDSLRSAYLDENEVRRGQDTDWLHIYPMPVQSGDQPRQFPKVLSFNTPYITVNGVHETRTELHAGNISGRTGRFNPPPLMYVNHVTYEPTDADGDGAKWESDDWWYIQHWTYKHYGNFGRLGNNFGRRTKRYGPYDNKQPPPASQIATYEWARYYDDNFIEGTVDEVYWDTNLNGQDPYRAGRYVDEGDAVYEGAFHRSTDPFWDRSGNRDRWNGYAKVDRRVLAGVSDQTVRVYRVAHTQYRPEEDSSGTRMSDGHRPFFEVRLKGGSDSGYAFVYRNDQTKNARWLGEPVPPEKLTGNEIRLSPGEHLDYRITPKYPRDKPNITPFVEDVTVVYENPRNIYRRVHYR